jgi:hypothetical protein
VHFVQAYIVILSSLYGIFNQVGVKFGLEGRLVGKRPQLLLGLLHSPQTHIQHLRIQLQEARENNQKVALKITASNNSPI